ncbi:dicarboxylate/amino acid:cation symporter [Thermosediminibacter oceani]|uniref:Sodium:dicarboxylate symporter n=1 Tax=Thermosediminibacter oceani (strain ATCC BAA-1034 / DSM 16646 / JW/IW-1228P) TaxID=555079 RepID=D9S1X2_THEOJ|nr:dicarboxylate/amino acid:cation symporter [Thermosediminibacter oceani]ADL07399.1 sodium:dicarboxylate symporter [Thermosediminibacter oceani DSM 16646]
MRINVTTKILIGLILGVFVGLLFTSAPGAATTYIKPFGDLFLNLIKMIIVPLVLSSLVVGAASTGDVGKLGRIGAKTLTYYLLTTAFAVALGLILGNILDPGMGMTLPPDAKVEVQQAPSVVETLLNIVPTNPIKAMAEANMLQIIVFAIFLGIAITFAGEKGKPVLNFFDSLAEISYKIVGIIMEYAPIGVFALIVPVVAANGPSVLLPLLKVIITVYLGCALHAVLVYSSLVFLFARMSPVKFFKGAAPAMLVAFTTSSSSATLPVSMEATEKNLGVSKSISSFVLPLGATINMDGTALYQGVCALFVAQVFGINLTLSEQIVIILTATLASIGTAGVPGAGLIMLTMVLQSVGLPLEGIALIAGIDRILDMVRTCINVTGDIAGSVVVAATEKELNQDTTLEVNV